MQAMASKVPEFVAPFDTEIVRKVTKVMKSSLGHGPSPPPVPLLIVAHLADAGDQRMLILIPMVRVNGCDWMCTVYR